MHRLHATRDATRCSLTGEQYVSNHAFQLNCEKFFIRQEIYHRIYCLVVWVDSVACRRAEQIWFTVPGRIS